MPNVVGDRFQITIDKRVREQLGIQPGDHAFEYIEDGLLIVEFLPKSHDRSLRGILKRPDVQAGSTDSAAEKEAAWRVRGGEVSAALGNGTRRRRTRSRAKAV
jgi:AbrB family looped-hinge helix DNA binding protein